MQVNDIRRQSNKMTDPNVSLKLGEGVKVKTSRGERDPPRLYSLLAGEGQTPRV